MRARERFPIASAVTRTLLLLCCSSCGKPRPEPAPTANRVAELPRLASNAPVDRVVEGQDPRKDSKLQALIDTARAELPTVRERYMKGLPPDAHLFVTTTLHSGSQDEQLFVAVRDWSDPNTVEGLIATPPLTPGFHNGDVIKVKQADIVDWTISRADGSEEGNIVGKYLDTIH
jgi:hypothetical protein